MNNPTSIQKGGFMALAAAIEYEQGMYSHEGYVVNKADDLLQHPLNIGAKTINSFVGEGMLHQYEWNSKDSYRVEDLAKEFLAAYQIEQRILQELGLLGIPASEMGAGQGIENRKCARRIDIYKVLFGEGNTYRLLKNSGLHIHVDIHRQRFADEFNTLLALARTSPAITSASSISHERQNGINCHRYNIIANPLTGVFTAIPEEKGYIASAAVLARRDTIRHQRWSEEWIAQGGEPEIFYGRDASFPISKTGYTDVRHRPEIGRGTFELRSSDSAPIDIEIAYTAIILGYINRIVQQNIPVKIASQEGEYEFSKHRIVLPTEATLQSLSEEAVRTGLGTSELQEYWGEITTFAEEFLPASDRTYLDPVWQMLETGENTASKILKYMEFQGYTGKPCYTEQQAAEANLFVWQLQQEAIASLREKTTR